MGVCMNNAPSSWIWCNIHFCNVRIVKPCSWRERQRCLKSGEAEHRSFFLPWRFLSFHSFQFNPIPCARVFALGWVISDSPFRGVQLCVENFHLAIDPVVFFSGIAPLCCKPLPTIVTNELQIEAWPRRPIPGLLYLLTSLFSVFWRSS